MRGACPIAAAAAVLLAAGPAAGGTVAGMVRLVGSRSAPNAVVYAEPVPLRPFPRPTAHATMDQVNMTFVPHVLPVLVGTTVDFPNSDVVRHNVFSPSKTKRFNLGTYPAGVSKSVTFDKPGTLALLCHVHPEMSAYILILETPYFAVTGADGRYALSSVPPGKYRLSTWHERSKPQTREIEVPVEVGVTADFDLE